jgi:hypothetical protein
MFQNWIKVFKFNTPSTPGYNTILCHFLAFRIFNLVLYTTFSFSASFKQQHLKESQNFSHYNQENTIINNARNEDSNTENKNLAESSKMIRSTWPVITASATQCSIWNVIKILLLQWYVVKSILLLHCNFRKYKYTTLFGTFRNTDNSGVKTIFCMALPSLNIYMYIYIHNKKPASKYQYA